MISVAKYATFSRPADTTQYTQFDVVSNSTTVGAAMQFTGGLSSKYMTVNRALLQKSGATATNATFTLHLFSADPGVQDDNLAMVAVAFSGANPAQYLGSIAFSILAAVSGVATGLVGDSGALGSNAVKISNANLSPSGTIYGVLTNVTATGYIPVSNESFAVTLFLTPEQQ